MRRIARTLELSLATHSRSANDAMREQRHTQLESLPGLVGRRLALGVDGLTANHRRTATTALSGLSMIVGGLRYIGNGAFVSVYKKGDEVVKVYRHTADLDEAARQEHMRSRAEMCDRLQGYLGTMVAAQTLSVEQHPLGDYRVVLARQPYVRGGSLDFFTSNTRSLNKAEVAEYFERQAEGKSQIMRLVEATFAGHDESGEVPDLNGWDNNRLVGPGELIRLIDAEPISEAEHPEVHGLILDQAAILADFVEAA
ncbi:MAG TPA: hypothetical protein VMR34_04095 [Candidatus Saccharimonadales bacterium]|nr:hypothetical protein [Candidatus Saccharimonadales bacterium]